MRSVDLLSSTSSTLSGRIEAAGRRGLTLPAMSDELAYEADGRMGVDRERIQKAGGIGYCAIIDPPAAAPAPAPAGEGDGVDGKPARVRGGAPLPRFMANCCRPGCIAPLRFAVDEGDVAGVGGVDDDADVTSDDGGRPGDDDDDDAVVVEEGDDGVDELPGRRAGRSSEPAAESRARTLESEPSVNEGDMAALRIDADGACCAANLAAADAPPLLRRAPPVAPNVRPGGNAATAAAASCGLGVEV